MRTRSLIHLAAMGIGLGNRVALLCTFPSACPTGEQYLFLRLLGFPGGSHECQSSPTPRPGPRRKQFGLRPPSRAAAAILGSVPGAVPKSALAPSFVPWSRPHYFSNPTTDHQEWNARCGNLEKRQRLPTQAGRPETRSAEKLGSLGPSFSLTAISNRCARPRPGCRVRAEGGAGTARPALLCPLRGRASGLDSTRTAGSRLALFPRASSPTRPLSWFW